MVETDHKPLVALFGSKHLDELPPRIFRFRLRMARFDYTISHVAGKMLFTADTLSRAPEPFTEGDVRHEAETEYLMEVCVRDLPASPQRLQVYCKAQQDDPICAKVMQHVQHGWPDKHKIEPALKQYWNVQGDLVVHKKLLLYGKRIVVPKALQRETLKKLHQGHQGIVRCQERARISVWWPGIGQQIKDLVQGCSTCAREFVPHPEPLIPTPLPEFPWQQVASDLFSFKGESYIVVTDYYSRYPEVLKLRDTTSKGVIDAIKAIFSRHGIPEILVSDNGPQYSSELFVKFAAEYNFVHVTSSPHYPRSNGHAERSVQTVKNILRKASDPLLAMLIYRSTPLPWCKLSPAELLMGRKLRTNLPILPDQLKPKWPYLKEFQMQDDRVKKNSKMNFDRQHKAQSLPQIPDDASVWITNERHQPAPGRVIEQAATPRSYIVTTEDGGHVRRNRQHLNIRPENPMTLPAQEEVTQQRQETETAEREPVQIQQTQPIMTRSRTGAGIHPPQRYGMFVTH